MTEVIKKMITSFSEFKSEWEKDAGSPEESIMYYLIAALNAEEDPKLSEAMMSVVIAEWHCIEDGSFPSGFKLDDIAKNCLGHFRGNKNIARSYIGGTSENNYQIDRGKLTMTVMSEDRDDLGLTTIHIKSGGRDESTALQVAKNKSGQWKLTNYISICRDVKNCYESNSEIMDWRTFQNRIKELYDKGVLPFWWTINSQLIRKKGPYIMDWWGLYVIKLQVPTDYPGYGPLGLEVLFDEEKDPAVTDNLQVVEISSPSGVDVFDFVYIDKQSFEYIREEALGYYVPLMGKPQEVKNVSVPVDAVVITASLWEQESEICYFRVHHNGLVPITKSEAVDILTSQLVEFVRFRGRFPSHIKLERVHQDGAMEFNISTEMPHDETDYVKVKGKLVWKFKEEYTFRMRITSDMLDERIRPLFEEFIRERS